MSLSFFAGIRGRLLTLVILAVLPAYILLIYTGLERRRHEKEDAIENTLRLLHISVRGHESALHNAQNLLAALAETPAVRSRDKAACSALFSGFLNTGSIYTGFSLADAEGQVLCTAPALTGKLSFHERPWYRHLTSLKVPVVGGYQRGLISGRSLVAIAHPILDPAGQVAGILTVGLDLNWFHRLAAEMELPRGSVLTLFDDQGTILTRNLDPEKWTGKQFSEGPLVRSILKNRREGTQEAVGPDGVQRVYAFAPLRATPGGDVFVILGIPSSVIFAEADEIFIRNLGLMALAAGFFLILSWIVGDLFFLRRINALIGAVGRMENGDLSARTRFPRGIGELSVLSHSFDRLGEALEEREAQRDRAEEKLRRLNRTLSMLSKINKAIVHIRQRKDLFQEACRIAVEEGNLLMAWAGLLDKEAQEIRPLAWQGKVEDYLEGLRISALVSPENRGPTGRALHTREPYICNDIKLEAPLAPWREKALRAGFHSLAAFPLKAHGEAIGTFNIYAGEAEYFDEDEVRLFTELAEDLSFALEFMEEEEKRQQAEDRIKASLEEKVVLLKEIHHRVKNNMQIISSLLRLQSRYVKDENALRVFVESQNRIRTMALIHEKLYQSRDFGRIDFGGYARDLAQQVYRSFGVDAQAISLHVQGQIHLGMDKAIPCGLLLNELLSNALKHAFPQGRGEIRIAMYAAEGRMHLRVQDDGAGLPPDLEVRKTHTLGFQLIDSLVEQIDGTLEVGRAQGTQFHISFPEENQKSGYLD